MLLSAKLSSQLGAKHPAKIEESLESSLEDENSNKSQLSWTQPDAQCFASGEQDLLEFLVRRTVVNL